MATIIDGSGVITVQGTSTSQGKIVLGEDTDNGTHSITLQANSVISSNITFTLPSSDGTSGQVIETDGSGSLKFSSKGFLNIPAVGTKTGSYTLAVGDIGKYVQVGSGGSITIPNSIFSEGDVISIFNNTSGSITITCSITTAYIAGTDSDKATVSLATRGVATILFISGTVCVISGNVT